MSVNMRTPESGLEHWDSYLVTMPEAYLGALDRPCCVSVEDTEFTTGIADSDVAINAGHLAKHEFAEADDEAVARALLEPGPGKGGAVESELDDQLDSETVQQLIRPHLADCELRRRGYSPGQVSRLQSSDWSVLGEGPKMA